MAVIHIHEFGGIATGIATRLAGPDVAQIAHNCILWDGTLRPMAKWVSKQGGLSGRYTVMFDGEKIITKNLLHAKLLSGSIYPDGTVIGLNPSPVDNNSSNVCYQNKFTQIDWIKEVGVTPPSITALSSIVYSRQFLSEKPVNRLYAASLVRNVNGKLEESTLVLLPEQSTQDVHYEGDACTVTLRISDALVRENCYVRLYRTVTALETGNELSNPLDTKWRLLSELKNYVAYQAGVYREYTYVDGGVSFDLDFDEYIANRFYPPPVQTYKYLVDTESGWNCIATNDGEIDISERYMTHAWPTENQVKLPATVTGVVSHYDTLFIGTTEKPYVVALSAGEALHLQVLAKPFPTAIPCMPGSLVESPAGAVYAAPTGLVALSADGAKLVTSSLATGLKPLYNVTYTANDATQNNATITFQDTTYATYKDGQYLGFCTVPTIDSGVFLFYGYLADVGDGINGAHRATRLGTFDYPNGTVVSSCVTKAGLAILNNDSIWEMPLPGMPDKDAYNNASKMCYRWKSKKYQIQAVTNFGYVRVIRDCSGFVRAKFYIDNICVYDAAVCDSSPMALPPSMTGHIFEIELHGTAVVHGVDFASSIEELIRNG